MDFQGGWDRKITIAQNSEEQEIFREVKTLKAQDHGRRLRAILVRKQEVGVGKDPNEE